MALPKKASGRGKGFSRPTRRSMQDAAVDALNIWQNPAAAPNNPANTPTAATPAVPDDPPDPPAAKDQTLFMRIMSSILGAYGLATPTLIAYFKDQNTAGNISDEPSEYEMLQALYSQPEFRARFPSIAEQADRQRAGDPNVKVWTPGEVIAYEQQLRENMHAYGISGYDVKETTAKLILGNVSANEAEARLSLAAYAATTAPQEFRDEFMAHEGVGPGDLVGYFLDPDRQKPIIEKRVATAKMQAWQKQAGGGADWGFSETLVDKGITDSQAQAAFAQAALLRTAEAGYGETLTEKETKSGLLDINADDKRKVERVVGQRQGQFGNTGGAAEDRSGVSGLRRS